MNVTTRAHHAKRRRVHVIAATTAAALIATACAQDPPKPKPLTAGRLDDRDFTRLRAAGGPHTVTPKPHRQAKRRTKERGSVNGIPAVWLRLVDCEASGDWRYGGPGGHTDPGYSEYEGGPNFTAETYRAYRLPGYPLHAYDATPLQQITVAKRVLRDQGPVAWPVCSKRVGLTMAAAA